MAGYRCGFILLPNAELSMVSNKMIVHSFYSVSTPAQIAACVVLERGDKWLANVRQQYEKIGEECTRILDLP